MTGIWQSFAFQLLPKMLIRNLVLWSILKGAAQVEKFQKILRPDNVSMPLTRIQT